LGQNVMVATVGDFLRLVEPARVKARVGALERRLESIRVDSRAVEPDDLFVALAGAKSDGHLYIEDALARGAAGCLVSASYQRDRRDAVSDLADRYGCAFIAVDAVLPALQGAAERYLERLGHVVRVGITGSNGKTTTKELIAEILSVYGPTYRSAGNLNSDIGVPLAVFGLRAEHRYAVMEMGMNRPGEIAELAWIVRPDIAAITNIAAAHTEFVGDTFGVAREKRAIFSHFDGSQVALVPEDEPFRAFLTEGVRGRIAFFGPSSTSGFEGWADRGAEGLEIRWREHAVKVALPGEHNLANVLCAISVAEQLEVPAEAVLEGLRRARALFGRSELVRGKVTVYRDCYNANPASVSAAVRTSDRISAKRRIYVIGEMKELGEESEGEHRRVAELLLGSRADAVYLVGEAFRGVFEALSSDLRAPSMSGGSSRGPTVKWAATAEEIASELASATSPGDLILLKGSRSVALESLVSVLPVEEKADGV